MMYGCDGWGWGGWIVMMIVMIVFWGSVITAGVLAIRYLAGAGAGVQRNRPTSVSTKAEDVLTERFARGEIDEDEYRRRMATIREHQS